MESSARLALGTALLLLFVHLPVAHAPDWNVYYFECLPVLAFISALGLWRFLAWAASATGRNWPGSMESRATGLASLGCLALLAGSWQGMTQLRKENHEWPADLHAVQDFVHSPGSPRSILFVPCTASQFLLCLYVQNEPDLARARVWVAHDRSAENAKLMALAPDRAPLIYGTEKELHGPRIGEDDRGPTAHP